MHSGSNAFWALLKYYNWPLEKKRGRSSNWVKRKENPPEGPLSWADPGVGAYGSDLGGAPCVAANRPNQTDTPSARSDAPLRAPPRSGERGRAPPSWPEWAMARERAIGLVARHHESGARGWTKASVPHAGPGWHAADSVRHSAPPPTSGHRFPRRRT